MATPVADETELDLKAIQRFLTAQRHKVAAAALSSLFAPEPLSDDDERLIRILRCVGRILWLELPDTSLTEHDDSTALGQTRGICSVCGCSEDDACPPGCGWANTAQNICTTCANA